MKTILIETRRKDEIFDLTPLVQKAIGDEDFDDGACLIFVSHTTCAVSTADLDPGTDLDFLDFLRKISPVVNYRHPHDSSHTPDHILSSIIGPSVTVPVNDGKLKLGRWQKIVLIELDGPKTRDVQLVFVEGE